MSDAILVDRCYFVLESGFYVICFIPSVESAEVCKTLCCTYSSGARDGGSGIGDVMW